MREVGHKILRGENPRSILHFVREKIQAYHGEYGVACVQQSLSGEAIINRGGASEATLTGDAYTPTVTTVPIYAGHSCSLILIPHLAFPVPFLQLMIKQ